MAQTETLGILEDIESLISDKLQVVSYKWLSRNYMVSSDDAKRLLQEFVQKHGTGFEVIYKLSGWLKSSSPSYHIRLVTGSKLAEAQQEFDGNCSVQVYSVQASIPKDPAVLWNAEFIQAEVLFKQPLSVDNCLRDNRFCGVSNSFVQRNVDGTPAISAAPQTKSAVGLGIQESIPKGGLKSHNVVKDVKIESNGTGNTGIQDHVSKPADKEKVFPLTTGKKKVQAEKSSATGGSLAKFWGRASAKSKPSSEPVENSNAVSNSVDAQICAREAAEGDSSDDDNQDVTIRKSSNNERSRKRRVVLDLSDEDEDVINLGSPDFPKQSSQDHKHDDKSLLEKGTLNSDEQIQNKSKVKEESTNQPEREDFSVISKCTSIGKSSSDKTQNCAPEISVNKKDNLNNTAPCSPKRRKVMKTRIDERGREVTEVVWEGEETETKKADNVTSTKDDKHASTNTVNRPPPPVKKSSANTTSNPTGKGGSKKAGNKDPKQGNILSFFKKV
ncbi:DNA polymerase delta subunit 3 isoform X1 [Senna tora]|uniref:DNA polymerase delta subunit 3 n=1 Tax=Senna tora TaxID=362788 RepID=A0A835CAP6_9FABA|nr:DNA polymerase delta subunit 3 isoform X1 [Senna tora]